MKEYIEREAAVSELNRIEKLYRDTYMSKVRAEMTHYCCEVIKHIPAADVVERKKGMWEKIPPYNQSYWKCSCCGKENKYAYKDGDATIYELQDFFCPNCGADMRGERDGRANT